MPDHITLHEANGDRRGFITAERCADLERARKGFSVRSRRGKLVRFVLYPHSQERVYFDMREGVIGLHDAGRTTIPVRGQAGQLLGNSRTLREHRPIPK